MEEKWKDIPNYEGFYQASTFGRIRSLDRTVMQQNSHGFISSHNFHGRIITPNINNHGYLYLCLCKDGKHWYAKVHRLIAMTFLPNLQNLSDVNHKDGNKTNNQVGNLEWCSHSDNQKHAIKVGLNKKPYAAGLHKKPVVQIDKNTNKIIAEYNSIREATLHFGKTNITNIGNALKGVHQCAYGFKWKYKGI